jgi:hypothetical protein
VNANGTGTCFIGGAIVPGSMRATTAWGAIHTDKGGVIYDGATAIGTVDYENGVVSYTAGIGNSGVVGPTWTYTPAAMPQAVTQSAGFTITIENRAQSYVRTMEPPPAPGTMSVSYAVAGKWYVLRDDGTGALRGLSSAYGAGTINYTTGTVSVTLGALPDVGSALIFQWIESKTATTTTIDILNNGRFFWPFNTSGEASLEDGNEAIKPGSLSVSWTLGATPYTLVDNGAGLLVPSGPAGGTGTVNYAKGTFRLEPSILPAKGTVVTVNFNRTAKVTSTATVASGAGSLGVTNIKPGSFSCTLTAQLKGQYKGGDIVNWGAPATFRVVDNGAGLLDVLIGTSYVHIGTINYAAGTFTLTPNTVIPTGVAAQLVAYDNCFIGTDKPLIIFNSTVE